MFSAATHRSETQVFRFSCELRHEIDPGQLQHALEETLLDFEAFRVVMKKGIFWHYLEDASLVPEIRQEDRPPCGPLYRGHRPSLLFDVTYFQSTINLEVFHVLSDGAGALSFFKALILKYLSLGMEIPWEEVVPHLTLPSSLSAMKADSFEHHTTGRKIRRIKSPRALRLRGIRYPQNRLKAIRIHLPAKEALTMAKSHQGTLTAFVCACLMRAIWEEFTPRRRKKAPLVISIPVDLRKYYPTDSLRNFFNSILISWPKGKDLPDLEELTIWVDQELKEETRPERLAERMNLFSAIERNMGIKLVPLFIKNIALKIAYGLGQRKNTAILSNVGVIRMEEPFASEIKAMDVCVSTEKMELSMVSYGDVLSATVSTPFINSEIQRRLVRLWTDGGLPAQIACNLLDRRDEQ